MLIQEWKKCFTMHVNGLLCWSPLKFLFRWGKSEEITRNDKRSSRPLSSFHIIHFLVFLFPRNSHLRLPRLQPTNLIWCKIFQICHCFRHSSCLWSSTCLLRTSSKQNLQQVKNPRTHHLITAKPNLEQKNQR